MRWVSGWLRGAVGHFFGRADSIEVRSQMYLTRTGARRRSFVSLRQRDSMALDADETQDETQDEILLDRVLRDATNSRSAR